MNDSLFEQGSITARSIRQDVYRPFAPLPMPQSDTLAPPPTTAANTGMPFVLDAVCNDHGRSSCSVSRLSLDQLTLTET